ncbi:hypothetical protein FOZ63_000650, partial [Perkinsus olseni]
ACEAKMVDIDKNVDSQATEIAELEEQVKSMHTEVHEQLEALKPNESEIEEQMNTLEEEKEKLEKRLMEINEELETLAARKSSIEQAEGQLMRSDKDTSEHFEARIAEQQLHQRQEADLKGYIATFKSVVLVGNDELTSVSAKQVAEMDAKMVKTREKAAAGATEFLLKEAAYLAVLKAEMESPDSPGEHVLQLLKQADKAWMTVDRFGRQYGEFIEEKPDAVAALRRVSDLYAACKDAAEPHKLEAMERIHRGMDVTGAPVMSIATPRSSEGGNSPQVQPPPPENTTEDAHSAAKVEVAGVEPACNTSDDRTEAPPPPPAQEKKAVAPPPPPPRKDDTENREAPEQPPESAVAAADATAPAGSEDDKLFDDLLK